MENHLVHYFLDVCGGYDFIIIPKLLATKKWRNRNRKTKLIMQFTIYDKNQNLQKVKLRDTHFLRFTCFKSRKVDTVIYDDHDCPRS